LISPRPKVAAALADRFRKNGAMASRRAPPVRRHHAPPGNTRWPDRSKFASPKGHYAPRIVPARFAAALRWQCRLNFGGTILRGFDPMNRVFTKTGGRANNRNCVPRHKLQRPAASGPRSPTKQYSPNPQRHAPIVTDPTKPLDRTPIARSRIHQSSRCQTGLFHLTISFFP
jgi:hypothetical protein